MSTRVFISMGTPYTPAQGAFRDGLEALLRDRCGADPRIIGKNEYPHGNPLSKIRDVMKECQGVLIVAYERKFVEAGSEKRGAPVEKSLASHRYTTPWNHIESAFAFAMGLPIYILCENGLTEDGLIETRLDWYVQHLDIEAEALQSPQIAESLRSWVGSLPPPKKPSSPTLPGVLQGRLGIAELKWPDLAMLGGLLTIGFGAGVTVSKYLPILLAQ